MLATIRRLTRTERLRVAILSGAMVLWFLMMMAVTRNAAETITAKTSMMGNAITRGFGLSDLVTPDAMVAQMVGVSFNHPIVLALVGAVTVSLGARAVQGELADGTLEATLSHPVSRTRYLAGYIVVMLISLTALMFVAWVSMLGWDRMLDVPGTLDAGRAAMMCLNAWVVFSTFAGISLLMSVVLARRSSAMFATLGILVVMYAVTFAERAWPVDWLEQVAKLSVFHWFNPGNTLLGVEVSVTDLLVPALVTAGTMALAIWRFERRDL